MEMWIVLVSALVFLVSCLILRNVLRKKDKYDTPPGPTPLPIVGNLMQIRYNDIVKSLMKLHKKYGSLYTVHLGPTRYMVLCGYDIMKEALVNDADAFSGRGDYPLFYNFTKGNGITFSNGEKWKQLRRFAMSALGHFGMGKRSMEERIQEEVKHLIKFFRDTQTAPIDPEFCMSCSLANIISSIVFGDRFDYNDKDFEEIVHCVQDCFQIMSSAWGTMYHIFPALFQYLPGPHTQAFKKLQTLKNYVSKRASMNQNTLDPNHPRDYIDNFLIKMEQEKDNPASFFNWETLTMSTLILFFAGIESGSTTMRFGFIYLMKNPQIQGKVHEEIDRVIGQNGIPNFEHRKQMPYTQAVIHEIQRHGDVIPLSLTHALTKDTELRGYKFPKGSLFIPLLTSVHFDPTMYKEAEIFDPTHFLDENGSFFLNPAFMPFSAGKRVCLAANLASMELFIYFATILQNFKLTPLVSPKDIDARPIAAFLSNVPPPFQFILHPR
ncbi:cytochrome P450 2F2-like [Ambystoma mexicanum]|uniref:cytochrome P450 2F2-like n=1 Tax=Ambystoma mexicanum TaxID=8296 RepID=UPI0037E8321A